MDGKNSETGAKELLSDSKTLIEELDKAIVEKQANEAREKSKRSVKATLIWLACILVVSVGIGVVGLTFAFDYLGVGSSKQIEVYINRGSSAKAVAETLEENGVIRSSLMFRLYSKLKGYESKFQYGLYIMSGDMGYDKLADTVMKEGKQADVVQLTIKEGSSVDDIALLFEANKICTKDEFYKLVQKGDFNYDFIKDIPDTVHYRLEGYLFPDTYKFYNYGGEECGRLAIEKMLSTFDEKVMTDEITALIKSRGSTLHEVLTMSSIVQLEAGTAEITDMSNVAAVFYNRLAWTDEPKLLGSSPTADYPYGNGAYDTNKNEGLPPGPLCSPGIEVIKATLNPTKDFTATYFVTDATEKFYYNNDYKSHLATISELKKKGLWK